MRQVYRFRLGRRLRNVRWPLAIALALLALLSWARPPPGSFRLWVPAAVAALLLARAAVILLEGRKQVLLTDEYIVRDRHTVRYENAELELRAMKGLKDVTVVECIVWPPPDKAGRRVGVGFDHSLEDFEGAVKELLFRVPDERVFVTVPPTRLEGEARERIVARFRRA